MSFIFHYLGQLISISFLFFPKRKNEQRSVGFPIYHPSSEMCHFSLWPKCLPAVQSPNKSQTVLFRDRKTPPVRQSGLGVLLNVQDGMKQPVRNENSPVTTQGNILVSGVPITKEEIIRSTARGLCQTVCLYDCPLCYNHKGKISFPPKHCTYDNGFQNLQHESMMSKYQWMAIDNSRKVGCSNCNLKGFWVWTWLRRGYSFDSGLPFCTTPPLSYVIARLDQWYWGTLVNHNIFILLGIPGWGEVNVFSLPSSEKYT